MTPTPPAQQEDQNLDTLKIFFYVYAALVALSTLLVGAIFLAVMAGIGVAAKDHHNDGAAAATAGVVGVIFAIAMLILAAKTVAVFFAGRYVGERSHYTFIFVVAIVCMINVPFGTALGAFTLVTLTKDPVKRRFGVPA